MNLNKHGDYRRKFEKTWPYFGGMKEKKEKELQTIQKRFQSPHLPRKLARKLIKSFSLVFLNA